MIRPILGNMDSGIRKILPCGIEIHEILPAESKFLGFEIWKTAQEIRNNTNEWNLYSPRNDSDPKIIPTPEMIPKSTPIEMIPY